MCRYANYKKWHFEMLSCHKSDIGGVKVFVHASRICMHVNRGLLELLFHQ